MKKFSRFLFFFLSAAFSLFLLSGCGTTGAPAETSGAPVEDRAQIAPIETSGINSSTLPSALTDPSSPLSRRSIYFALDRYDIAEEYRELVTAHARFLIANPQFKTLIQGNTDERGSREYNLSLGQKRAEAVKQMLMLLGAQESQIEAVSLGEEKPRAEGHDEAAWAENRRADLLYSGEF
ncbi:MAG: peptidoglycan-associated lipoprotein Pal [Zoogloeaceae bacterium]|jgi:peptidoglycan-associated lipoprotein|nr:peptidoglycan-associated lipoprotein Pal [Zoogloeaceae bacterium]